MHKVHNFKGWQYLTFLTYWYDVTYVFPNGIKPAFVFIEINLNSMEILC